MKQQSQSIQEGGAHSSRKRVQKGWGTSPGRAGIAFRWDGSHSFTDSMGRWEHTSGRMSRRDGATVPQEEFPGVWTHLQGDHPGGATVLGWSRRKKSPEGLLVRDNGFWDCV